MSSWTTYVRDYLAHRRFAGQAAGTVRINGDYLRRLAERYPDGDPLTITFEELMAWMGDTGAGWLPETRKQARSVLRTFFGWLQLNEYRADNPTLRIPAVKVPQTFARPIPDDIIRTTVAAEPADTGLMILLGATAGLRCAEIAAVHADNWDGRFSLTSSGRVTNTARWRSSIRC